MSKNHKKSLRKSLLKTPYIWVVALLIVAGFGFGFWKWHHSSSPTQQKSVSSTYSTKGEPSGSSNTPQAQPSTPANNQLNGSQTGNSQKNNYATTPVAMLPPSGDFVSAHHVLLSSALSSVCNSSPGVECSISFSSGGTTKSLPSQTTGNSGTTYWNSWTPQSIGLSVGTWSIEATVTAGSQTKTAQDSLSLEVTQ